MLPGGDHYQLTCEFLNWCKTYPADENAVNSLTCHMLRLKEASCKTLVLDGNQPVDALCARVLNTFWADQMRFGLMKASSNLATTSDPMLLMPCNFWLKRLKVNVLPKSNEDSNLL